MLTLTRKPGETLIIGDPTSPDCILVTLVDRRGRIGITAPDDVKILRAELVDIRPTEASQHVQEHFGQNGGWR